MATENNKSSKPNNNKKKRQRYLPQNRPVKKKGAYPLKPGVQGFFITCDGGKEYQASHEAINVLDSFYEELVQGTESTLEHAELLKKPMNKKIKFESSDSSSSDDDDEDDDEDGDGDNDGDADQKDEDDKHKPDADSSSHNNNGSIINTNPPQKEGEISSEKQIQESEDNKEEETKNKKIQEVEAAEPPTKKQCLESVVTRCENIPSSKREEKSVDKLIEAELAELGDRSKRSFSNLDTGCNGVVFVQMRKRDGDPSPKTIVQHMMTSLALSKKHVSRFILRVLPVEITCYASDEEIVRAIKPLIAQNFPVETQTPHKFAVLYDARANTGIDRMKIIDAVAKSVPPPHKVDLSNPDINIVVQIVKTVCLIGVVEKYKELAKYNLRQLTSKN